MNSPSFGCEEAKEEIKPEVTEEKEESETQKKGFFHDDDEDDSVSHASQDN